MTQERITESIRQDWDERARKNAFFYIASWRSDWNAESFFESGEEDYARLVKPVLDTAGFETAGKAIVEVGCGAGRMTRCFARRFGRVTAVDVSSEMQDRAKHYLADFKNIDWLFLRGGSSLHRDYRPCIVSELHSEETRSELRRLLASCGYLLSDVDDSHLVAHW